MIIHNGATKATKRAADEAITAADAVLLVKVKDVVGVLDNGARSQTGSQPGAAQCMQPSLRISHCSLPAPASTSKKRITVQY